MSLDKTMKFSLKNESKRTPEQILHEVFSSMQEKGYDPVNQIVGYLISGDPTYITSYNNARYMMCQIERDEVLEELISFYIKNHQ